VDNQFKHFPTSTLIEQFAERMVVLADSAFLAKAGDPLNLKICPCGTWNERMVVETVLLIAEFSL
jgi:hypothetical protein